MLPIHTTLMLNRRFCECYEELFHLFVTNDQLSTYFAFKGKGLEYLLRTIEIEEPVGLAVSVKSSPGVSSPEEEFLVKEGLITTKISRDVVCTDIKELEDLKEE